MAAIAAFAPGSEENAIFLLAAVVCFALAAFVGAAAKRFPGGAVGLVALGLGLWLWPTMWNTMETAF